MTPVGLVQKMESDPECHGIKGEVVPKTWVNLVTNTFKVGGSFDWEIPVVEETQERVDRSVPSVMVQMTVLLSKVEIFRLYLVLNHL